MDPRLLEYYNRELAYVREMGAEFAQEHPKIAGRLGMKGIDVADPYVERLLEGFALLAGRIQLKMDAEFPRFSQRLLALIYPHYLAPTPAMGIVRLHPNDTEGGIAGPFQVPRLTVLRAPISPGQVTACQFRTAHGVELLPVHIQAAWIEGSASDVRIPASQKKVLSSLHLVMETQGDKEFRSIDFDTLPIYIAGPFDRALLLLELICGRLVGGVIQWRSAEGKDHQAWLSAEQVSGMGFENDEALIPYGEQSFSGYRLLHEYFACPDRFRFFKLSGLRQLLKHVSATRIEIVLHFDRAATELEKVVSEESFHLYCTPVINLFPKKGDRIDVSLTVFEHHLLADRTRSLDYEIYSVSSIQGYAVNNTDVQTFLPIYETLGALEHTHSQAYFSLRREPRKLSEVAKRNGPRTGYIGSDVFAQLVDRQDVPYPSSLSRIAPDMLCTNRDLPLLITSAGERNFQLSVSAPVQRVELVTTLTRPVPAMAERKATWRLLSHLQLNYHTLTDVSPTEGAKVLSELLGLYSQLGRPETAQQAESIASMSVSPTYARLNIPGPIIYGRGVDIHVTLDHAKFGGASPWLFGAVLERFFARHVGINSATRMAMGTLQNGPFARWATRWGMRPSV